MNPLLKRWEEMNSTRRSQSVAAAVVVMYILWSAIAGNHGWIYKHVPIGIVLVGVVYGSVYALGAIGLILIYRANRFINFAYGALGSLIGVLTVGLVEVHGLNYWIALPLSVLVGAVVGAGTDVLIIRRFSRSPRLIVTVASIGLAQVYGGIELLGSTHEGFTGLLGAFPIPLNLHFTYSVHTFDSAEILIMMIVPAVIAFLAWFLLRTDVGVAVRAAAENEDRALLLGIPVRRIGTIVWAIGGSLAVLTYMLSAPFEGVKPGVASNGPTVLLPLLAAAVVARLESLPIAFGSAVALGIAEQLVHWNAPNHPGLVYVVYFLAILLALLAQSGQLSRAKVAGASTWASIAVLKPVPEELRRVPEIIWGKRAMIAGVLALFIFVPWGWGPTSQLEAAFAMVWAIAGVSLVVLTGWSGQVSLGQFGIAGLAGVLATNMISRWNTDLFVVIAAAAVAGGVIALLVGLPAIRIRGLFLAVTTLALAVMLDEYIIQPSNFQAAIPTSELGKELVLQRFNLNDDYEMYILCFMFLVLSVLLTVGLRKARAGRVLIATENNERAAQAASVPTTIVRLQGFVVAGIIAGVAGALDAVLLGGVQPGNFPSIDSITIFAYSVIGGLGSVTGMLSGVLFFKYLETVTALGQVHELISGAALLWVLSIVPGGIGQIIYAGRDRVLRLVADRRGILVPSLVADRRTEAEGDHAENEESLLIGALGGPSRPADDTQEVPV
ncbi:MAG TPA: ABC transporter permease [Acidimicrobiales bacterium]|jgi:branched-chain amino acid transport system permease protein|nr:ABC transporter permease [Acidimicrobiales bacterium]